MYEIKVLSDGEFDNLPETETRGSNISDSLGFANPFTGKAYVRQTGIHELNKYLVDHELEELEASHSLHEDENGIRHKKFFKDLFLPLITRGLLQPKAPQKEAAQTTFVEGVGNIPEARAQATSAIPQISGPQQEFQFPTASPLSAFSVSGDQATPRVPSEFTGSTTGSLFQGNLNSPLQERGGDVEDILKFYRQGAPSGRIVF